MIRKALIADVNKINKIGEQDNSHFAKLFHIETEINNENAIVLVEEEIEILGFIYALDFGDNIDLLYIIVDQKHRGEKIGTKLLKYFVDNYQINNKTITLEVSVENKVAMNLYQKFNFQKVNLRKGYYHGVDAIVMRRD